MHFILSGTLFLSLIMKLWKNKMPCKNKFPILFQFIKIVSQIYSFMSVFSRAHTFRQQVFIQTNLLNSIVSTRSIRCNYQPGRDVHCPNSTVNKFRVALPPPLLSNIYDIWYRLFWCGFAHRILFWTDFKFQLSNKKKKNALM